MSEVAARSTPDPQRDLADALRRTVAAVQGGTLAAERAVEARGELVELMAWARRLAETEAAIRAAGVALLAAGMPASEPQAPSRRHRHRAPSPRSGRPLSSVPSAIAKGAAAAAVVAAVSAGGIAAISVHEESAATAVAPARHVLHRMAPRRAAVIPPPGRHRRHAADVASARPAPPSPSSVLPPSPSVSPSAVVPAGVLAADSTVVALRGTSQATVTLTAEGGPVSWSAGQQPGVVVDPGSGTLQAGESATVTVTATDLTHSGFAIVDLGGGVSLSVSWTAEAGLLGVARLL